MGKLNEKKTNKRIQLNTKHIVSKKKKKKKFQNKISLAQFNSFKIEIKDTVIDFLKRSMFTNNIAVI